jgi:hypothetical protein
MILSQISQKYESKWKTPRRTDVAIDHETDEIDGWMENAHNKRSHAQGTGPS